MGIGLGNISTGSFVWGGAGGNREGGKGPRSVELLSSWSLSFCHLASGMQTYMALVP